MKQLEKGQKKLKNMTLNQLHEEIIFLILLKTVDNRILLYEK